MKKRRVKKRIFLVLFLLALVGFCLIYFLGVGKKKEQPVAKEIEVIDTIDNFDYALNDNETEYYNSVFNELKDLLSGEYENRDYAILVGKLFLIDFYDLNNKVMKSDVGGTQFVYAPYREDFEKGAMDTVYKSVQSNVYGDRKQELPIVKSVENTDLELKLFEYNGDIDYDAYYLNMSITYETDLGYPNEVLLVLIHNGDKLEIAKMETM